ncbi:hypothetical protein SLEP1_g54045 [Rubroshorea leprosula]|uniref:Uncharacterized protein n=2 Tax=Rubroshorea leprosula TaxID=152421 RepID=A0AAV5MBG3_9ROSI|nr:hypothetical protein SLEP1_g54045 [Rubroshorea leprosula]
MYFQQMRLRKKDQSPRHSSKEANKGQVKLSLMETAAYQRRQQRNKRKVGKWIGMEGPQSFGVHIQCLTS